MNLTESTSAASGPAIDPAIFHPAGQCKEEQSSPAKIVSARTGYGLPCAKCRTYYAADVAACPVCSSAERVSPGVAPVSGLSAEVGAAPDEAVLEAERERFLQEFQSHLRAGEIQINASESFGCTIDKNHPGGFEAASVCQSCYEHVRERADLAEAALLIDIREAAQLVYDAVWSDPSDPSKTYQNAARALLNEMRRRAGISLVIGPRKTLTD